MKYLNVYILFLFFFFPLTLSAQYVPDFKVNDDIPGLLYQTRSSVSANDEGYFVVVWESYGSVTTGRPKLIYFQIFGKWANRIGPNIRVNMNDTISIRPSIAVRKDSSFVIAWIKNNYKMRIFDKNGNAITPEITVNDSILYASGNIRLGVDLNNNIYCTYYYTPSFNTPRNIYYQKFDPQGNIIISPVKVNDDINNSQKESPDITVRRDGSFIIAWRDDRISGSGAGDIFMQMFDPNGNKVGVNNLVNENIIFTIQNNPSISSDSSGNFNIVWEDDRLTQNYFQPWCQAYNMNGIKMGNNFRVDQGFSFNKTNSKISKRSDGKYVVGWTDGSFNPNLVMFRRFNFDNSPIGGNFFVSNQKMSTRKIINNLVLIGDLIINVWWDYRNDPNESDIYCNILSFQNPDSIISNIVSYNEEIPAEFKLYQNYPNPFNPSTSIKFEIPEDGKVNLAIYNIVGKEVTVLVNEYLSSGNYEYIWNTSNLSSGVYYYVLKTGSFTGSKTALLVK